MNRPARQSIVLAAILCVAAGPSRAGGAYCVEVEGANKRAMASTVAGPGSAAWNDATRKFQERFRHSPSTCWASDTEHGFMMLLKLDDPVKAGDFEAAAGFGATPAEALDDAKQALDYRTLTDWEPGDGGWEIWDQRRF